MSLSSTAQREILRLISKSHAPLVGVRSSRVEAVGRGVFSNTRVLCGRFLCLYPGVYSAGLPLIIIAEEEAVFLGCSTTPSSVNVDENAYILNLVTTSGYLDGLALNDEQGCRLDENPSACGHLINHSSEEPNVKVLSFPWHGIVPRPLRRRTNYTWYSIPNVSRFDGAARFVLNDELVCYDGQEPTCGAAFFATKDIEQDEELLLDYGLHEPYPTWAKKWYDKCDSNDYEVLSFGKRKRGL